MRKDFTFHRSGGHSVFDAVDLENLRYLIRKRKSDFLCFWEGVALILSTKFVHTPLLDVMGIHQLRFVLPLGVNGQVSV